MGLRIESTLDLSKLKTRKDAIKPDALARAGEHIRGVAVERTPVETGHLAGSAEVKVDIENSRVGVEYPGPYARYQHEELQLHHETGQAKYLESTLVDETSTALGILADSIKGAI